jgi:DNA polymerase-3 subunit delta'
MINATKLYGKKTVTDKLAAMQESGRMPHTVIFCGAKGVGKSVLSRYLAALYVCESQNNLENVSNVDSANAVPCGVCRACRLVFSSNHPDVIYPDKTGKQQIFTRDTMRALCADAYIKPSEAEIKTYILTDFESTDRTSQNILLKIIEDPPGGVRFIFTASEIGKILPTILSRAVVINVPEATDEECRAALTDLSASGIIPKNTDNSDPVPITRAQIDEAVAAFHGNIGDCLGFLAGGEQAALHRRLVRLVDAIAKMNEYDFIAALAEASDTRESRERLDTLLRMTCMVLRDGVMIADCDTPKFIGSYSEGAKALTRRFSKNRIMKIYDILSENAEKLSFNVNGALFSASLAAEIFDTAV